MHIVFKHDRKSQQPRSFTLHALVLGCLVLGGGTLAEGARLASEQLW